MKSSALRIVVVVFFLCIWSVPVVAGESIFPGADPGPNATGEITAYMGKKGLTCPADYKEGHFMANPFKDEKPLYRIDHTNIAQYEDRMSPGQIARIKRNENFYFNIYPTRRIFVYNKAVLDATAKNLKTCKTDSDNNLHGFNGGVPFPIPQNGVQGAWNIKRPFSNDDLKKTDTRRVVSPSGRIKKDIQFTRVIQMDENRLYSKIANPDKIDKKIMSLYTYPADKAGGGILIFTYMDSSRPDDSWLYIPTLRRVRRAPTLARGAQIDGESTMDEFGYFFRGPINDWNWKLLGKREMYIADNAYGMWKVGTPDNEECLPGDINPKNLRYELRRVWVIESTIKEGVDHPYSKRVFYADEDTWYAMAADC